MAHHIKMTGEVIPIEPKNGRSFSLQELQAFVGGYIEIVPVNRGMTVVDAANGTQIGITRNQVLVVNEEGRIKDLAENSLASLIAAQLVVGDVLLCKSREVR
jgi:hypothetical protein